MNIFFSSLPLLLLLYEKVRVGDSVFLLLLLSDDFKGVLATSDTVAPIVIVLWRGVELQEGVGKAHVLPNGLVNTVELRVEQCMFVSH